MSYKTHYLFKQLIGMSSMITKNVNLCLDVQLRRFWVLIKKINRYLFKLCQKMTYIMLLNVYVLELIFKQRVVQNPPFSVNYLNKENMKR